MKDYEKLGLLYLGRPLDERGEPLDAPLLYDARELVTHALCVGMTGSGKTGLCLALLEEAAIDGIPAIAIDPKGDLGNLMLTFPALAPADFRPWIEPSEAARAGRTPEEHAAATAELWRKGLADSGQPPERIARFKDACEVAIYTPGSSAGLPLSILKSFAPPPASTASDPDLLRERVLGTVSGLLGLLGIEADPLQSREHILFALLLERAWSEGRALTLADLVREVQTPPIERVGVLDLETFFPAKERGTLALRINNLLAAPGFAAWMQGEALDVQRLLWTPEGKPRIAILSIAHLSDAERLFFVTLVLEELVAWMRTQAGTTSLRALVYMDEIFGYFPPSANPPTKTPLLTLLKQGRAFGLGCVLATQNPVDLDYKGLANCGTWFLGRLQTERDKLRVLDGLEGASATSGAAFDRAEMERILAGLGKRVFLLHSVHAERPQLFRTRWTLSYLRGPLTRSQIATLMAPATAGLQPGSVPPPPSSPSASAPSTPLPGEEATLERAGPGGARPPLPAGVTELFLPPVHAGAVRYAPHLLGEARVHFVDAKRGVDAWQSLAVLAPLARADGNPW
ncbi:MAG TPA: ATP-binding protein, partial [Planctomycetota bacterium]